VHLVELNRLEDMIEKQDCRTEQGQIAVGGMNRERCLALGWNALRSLFGTSPHPVRREKAKFVRSMVESDFAVTTSEQLLNVWNHLSN